MMVRQHLIILGLFALALPLVWWGDGVLFKPVSGPLPVDLRGLVFGAYLLWLLLYASMSSLAFFLLKTEGLFMLHGVSAILAVVLLISGFTVHGMAHDRHSRHSAENAMPWNSRVVPAWSRIFE